MKKAFLLISIMLPIGMFAQGNHTNIQGQNVNYFNQIDETNNSLGNAFNKINDDVIQTNIAVQAVNPPVQSQQGSSAGNFFNSPNNDNQQIKKPYCKDCEAVKKAIAAAHASSGGSHSGKHFSIKNWYERVSYNANLKMKKIFARKYKAKTSYSVCFNW